MPSTRSRTQLPALAAFALAASLALTGDSPTPPRPAIADDTPHVTPSTIYAGHATYRDGKPDFRLKTSSTGRRLIVLPGYFRLAQHCDKRWRGTVDASALPNRHALTVTAGRFSGSGRSSFRPGAGLPTYVARWTVSGRFTSATTARGTMRISMHWTQGGRTVLRCSVETVAWATTTTSPAGSRSSSARS